MTTSQKVDPRPGESEDDFVERCMGSETMQSEFSDADQRLAVCHSKFNDRDKQDVSTEDLSEGGGLVNPEQGRRCPPGTRWDADKQMCVVEETFATSRARQFDHLWRSGFCHDHGARGCEVCTKQDPHGCGPDERYDGTLGRCVKKELVDAWSPENELLNLKSEVARRVAMKNRLRQEPPVGIGSLGNRQVDDREDPDPFLAIELSFALALSERTFRVADEEILPLYDDQVLPSDPSRFNQARLDDANDRAGSIWQNVVWTATLAAAARSLVGRSFRAGEGQISAGIAQGAPSVDRVLSNMEAVTQFRTNEFFNSQVVPSIQRKINDLFNDTDAFDTVNLDPIRRTLDRRLKSVPYWRVVANAAASRSYHYGVLKAAQFQGFTGYRFVAILDERTSEICRELNGTEYFVADAVNKFEMVAGSDDPDEVKRVFPWVNVNDVRGQNSDALRDMGVMVPPLHGNCRSTLRPIF